MSLDNVEVTLQSQTPAASSPASKTAAGTVPYPTREEIEKSNLLAGTEVVWLGDPFEAYIVQVQGSARLRMPDGKLVTFGYAGSNGQDYKSVSNLLVEEHKMERGQVSLKKMIEYFKAHPEYLKMDGKYLQADYTIEKDADKLFPYYIVRFLPAGITGLGETERRRVVA
jgi:membrane-bound lytic murein transglycosylase